VPDIRVVTNSLYIANLLNQYGKCHSVDLSGGTLRSDSYLYGRLTNFTLSQFTADITFVGCMAFSVERGITEPDSMAAETKRIFIRNARHAVLVTDHTKMGREAPVLVEPLSAVHTIVTTREAAPEGLKAIRKIGVQVITC
jgi:DeoR/GlpR family transcriptional regulator of sugar metabolism